STFDLRPSTFDLRPSTFDLRPLPHRGALAGRGAGGGGEGVAVAPLHLPVGHLDVEAGAAVEREAFVLLWRERLLGRLPFLLGVLHAEVVDAAEDGEERLLDPAEVGERDGAAAELAVFGARAEDGVDERFEPARRRLVERAARRLDGVGQHDDGLLGRGRAGAGVAELAP